MGAVSTGWSAALGAVVRRPRLWPTALGMARRATPARWYRQAPFLPVPDWVYLRFRLETQYGSVRPPSPTDVVDYLAWCRSENRRLKTNT